MQKNNPRYKNQGIHSIVTLLTVEDKKFKVLLVKRKNEPFKDFWCLLGGALYNDETLENGVAREIKEKSGIENVKPMMFKIFSEPNRAKETGYRMIGIAYLALIDSSAINFIKETAKTSDINWFEINNVPNLAYDHNEVLDESIKFLQTKIYNPKILKMLFPNEVTIPELQNAIETILNVKIDRRNFRKKLLQENIIVDTGKEKSMFGNKPCKLYIINK